MRIFVVDNYNQLEADYAVTLARQLKALFSEDQVWIASTTAPSGLPEGCMHLQVPAELQTKPKTKNFIIRYFKEQNLADSCLHLVEDKVELKHDPMQFVADIERMMQAYGTHNWMGTVTDGCNYVYSKYNPRLDIVVDNPQVAASSGVKNGVFCSHSNVQWIVCKLDGADDDELYFNESFTVDMYWIIEFLARRRNTHPGSMYFMNQYYTCKSEHGAYGFKKDQKAKQEDQSDLQKRMQEEDQLFKSMHINYSPDNNVDKVLETFYSKLQPTS